MKVTILNGNPDATGRGLETYLVGFEQELVAEGHVVTNLTLRDMDIRYCTGCFGCWLKTPGECGTKDESCVVRQAVIASDWTIMASPVVMGFQSALLKKTMDKLIPLIHPYIVIEGGEMHHRARYTHYPKLGLLLEKSADTDAEDIEIVTNIFSRTARNLKTSMKFSYLIDTPVKEVAHEVNRL